MADNKFISKFIGMLDRASSKKQINSNIRELEKAVNTIRLTAVLAKGESKKQLNETVRQLEEQMAQIKLKVKPDYLKAVREFNKHGFYGEAGKALGELTLKAQASGSISAEAAQNYLLAADAAYHYKGNAEKLSAILDGQNAIADRHNINMETLAAVTEKAGSVAASTGIKISELSAMTGTIAAGTGENGTAIGRGIISLLNNLQNISSDKIVNTLQKANASMTETVNGTEKLRNPIAILKDLAETYNTLDENNPLKSEITADIGQDSPKQLAALLKGWQDYENMLTEYSNGKGSALEDAKQSAQNLNSTLNKLSNSWTELVNSMINPNTWKTGSNIFDNIIQHASELVPDLTPLGTLGLEAGLFTGFKNTGKRRMSVRIS